MIYTFNEAWREYYEVLEPEKRKALLEKLSKSVPDDGANRFRKKLFEQRHTDPKKADHMIDLFLWQCVYLPGLYRKRNFFLFNARQEMQRALKDSFLDGSVRMNAAEKSALYWELRNAAARYFATCSGSRYGNKFLGMKHATMEEKRERACEDAWIMSRGMALCSGLEKEMQIFIDAVRDEYDNYEVGGADKFDAYGAAHEAQARRSNRWDRQNKIGIKK